MQHSGETDRNEIQKSNGNFRVEILRIESLKIERLEQKSQMVVKQIEMKFDNLKETEQYRRIQGGNSNGKKVLNSNDKSKQAIWWRKRQK